MKIACIRGFEFKAKPIILILLLTTTLSGCNKKEISVSGVNSETVNKYEKFEITLNLKNAEVENPYDPADIDIYALFKTPSGKEIKINGFFDNYRNAGKWKIPLFSSRNRRI